MKYLKIILFFFFAMVFAGQIHALDWEVKEVDGIMYRLWAADSIATVVSPVGRVDNPYTYYSGMVNIPSSFTYEWQNYTVVAIENKAFFGQQKITTVIIPKTVESIGDHAFEGISTLTSVVFPASGVLETIGKAAFKSCSMRSIKLPNSLLSIGEEAFMYCKQLQSVQCGDNIETLGANVFQGCISLTEIVFPQSLKTLGDHAFWECKALKKVTMNDGLETIGHEAFLQCDYLDGVVIPNTVKKIEFDAFRWCLNLTSIEIPNSVEEIGYGIFRYCTKLKNVKLSNSIKEIPSWAFEQTAIEYIEIPDPVTDILPFAFRDCSQLKEIKWGNSLKNIGQEAFENTNIKTLILPKPLYRIGELAFTNCDSLTEVTIPSTTSQIIDNAFSDCSQLKTVYNLSLTPQAIPYTNCPFAFCDNPVEVHVYEGYKEAYEPQTGWSEAVRQGFVVILDDLPAIKATSLTLDEPSYICLVGEQGQATPNILPENAYCDVLSWSSSDESILYIDEFTGQFIGLEEGAVTITATTTDGTNLQATALVYVSKNDSIVVSGISLKNSSLTIGVGKQVTITANVQPANASVKELAWTSDNEAVATVANGVVTGVALGQATITATATDGSGVAASCEVNVENSKAGNYYLVNAYVSLSNTLTVNSDLSNVSAAYSDATNAKLSNKGFNANVTGAKANPNYIWSIEEAGSTSDGKSLYTIKNFAHNAYLNNTKAANSYYAMTANADEAGKFVVSTSEVVPGFVCFANTLASDATKKFLYADSGSKIKNFVATGASGSWYLVPVSDETIVAIGQAGLTVLTTDVTLNESSLTLTNAGDTAKLQATVSPSNATYKSVTWTSSNTEVATVNSSGVVTAVGNGTATITVTTADGSNKTSSCEVTVNMPVQATGVTLNQTSLTLTSEGQVAKLQATVLPSDAPIKSVTWTSSNPSVATVNSNGLVTAVSNGEATITVTTADGSNKTATCEVVVNIPMQATGVTLNQSSLSLTSIGDTVTLIATVSPDSAMDKSVIWTSSNTEVATIDSNGMVTAIANGTAIITVTTADGSNKTATCEVTVTSQENEPTVDEDTDISTLQNVIYIDKVEAQSGSQMNLSIKMKNNANIRSFQFDLYLPEGVTAVKNAKGRIMGSLNSGRLPEDDEHTLTMAVQSDGAIRFLCGSQYDETFAGTDGEIASLQVNISEDMDEGDYPIILKSIRLSETDISKFYDTPFVKTTLTISNYILGDINGDGIVNVTDYTGVANHILGFAQSGFNTKAADVNTDNVINVSDYTGVANIILSGNVYGQSNAVRAMMPTVKRTPTDLSTLNNIIYVEPMTVAKGTQATLSFQMKNNTDIRSFQFDLYLPEGVTAVTNSNGRIMASLSSGRLPEDDEHTLTMAFQPNGAIRFLCGSQYDESFTGTDGEIATLQVLISDSMNEGNYPIIIKDMRLSKTDINQYFDSDNIETTLTVGDNTVVLDENSTEVPVATSGDVDIKVKRTIYANEWSTICLPFDMTETQLKEAFGDDVELSEFDSYDAEYDADDNVTSIVVNFSPVNLTEGLYANTPYIIRTKSDISEFDVTATINPDEENALVEYDNGKTGKRREVYGTFYGTYHANTIVPANALFISGNNFYYSTGLTKMKAFRAYFEFEDVLSSVDGSATIRMSMDRDLTGISDVLQDAPADTYYDLQGRRVLRPSKGVYIYQGKKIYVK